MGKNNTGGMFTQECVIRQKNPKLLSEQRNVKSFFTGIVSKLGLKCSLMLISGWSDVCITEERLGTKAKLTSQASAVLTPCS